MARTPEGKVKDWLYGSHDKPGELIKRFPGAYVYKPPGGMYGNAGTPDCFLLWRGVFVAIEVKAGDNAPTDLQMRALKKITESGGIAAVIHGKDLHKLDLIYQKVMERVR